MSNKTLQPIKPDIAVRLVQSYSRLTKEILRFTSLINDQLYQCNGLKGLRQKQMSADWDGNFDELEDKTHLSYWYTYFKDDECFGIEMEDSGVCKFCESAHKLIQERKQLRQELGHIKRSMTRLGAT